MRQKRLEVREAGNDQGKVESSKDSKQERKLAQEETMPRKWLPSWSRERTQRGWDTVWAPWYTEIPYSPLPRLHKSEKCIRPTQRALVFTQIENFIYIPAEQGQVLVRAFWPWQSIVIHLFNPSFGNRHVAWHYSFLWHTNNASMSKHLHACANMKQLG